MAKAKGITKNFLRFSELYKDVKDSDSAAKEARDILTKKVPSILQRRIPRSFKYTIYGSLGIGNIAEIPWIGILDKDITSSTTKGYYVAFLFSKHAQSVHLCLCLGWTQFNEVYGRAEGLRQIRTVSKYYGKKLGKRTYFKAGPVALGAKTQLGKGYENGVILSRKISFISMTDETIVNDINELLKYYDRLKQLVGSSVLNLEIEVDEYDKDVSAFQKEIAKHTLRPVDEKSIQTLIDRAKTNPPKIKERLLKQIARVKPFADYVKQKNNYICELCGRKPFLQRNGLPYAEADHITPLGGKSKGKDSPENMRCLCAQCHAIVTHGSEEEINVLLTK